MQCRHVYVQEPSIGVTQRLSLLTATQNVSSCRHCCLFAERTPRTEQSVHEKQRKAATPGTPVADDGHADGVDERQRRAAEMKRKV